MRASLERHEQIWFHIAIRTELLITERNKIIYIESLVNTLEAPHIKFSLLRKTMKHTSTVLLNIQTLQKE
jgi:hypothetical protein